MATDNGFRDFDLNEVARRIELDEFSDRGVIQDRPDAGLADTGARVESATGALRDRTDEKKLRRYDLLPREPLYRFALHMGRGAAKYAARNWEKGMPLSEFYNSAMDHMLKFACGFDDEPHLDAALWNIACLIEGKERIRRGMWPKEYDDIGRMYEGQKP